MIREGGAAIEGPTRKVFSFWVKLPAGREGGGPGLRRRMKSRGGSIRTGEANKGRQSDQGLKMSKVEVGESIMFTIMLQSSQKRVHVKQINSIIVQPTFAYFSDQMLQLSITYGVRNPRSNLHEFKSVGSAVDDSSL